MRLQLNLSNVRQVAHLLAVVETVSHNKKVGDSENGIIRRKIHCSAVGLVEKGVNLQRKGISLLQFFAYLGESVACVNDILRNYYVIFGDIAFQVQCYVYIA